MKNLKIWMIAVTSLLMTVSLSASSVPTTGRIWNYNIITTEISKDFGIVTIPGFKYEYLRYISGEKADSKGALAYEFFIGPYFLTHLSNVKVMIPLVYHYMGFPDTPKASNFSYNHNFDVFPSFLYRHNKSMLQWRIFFHNTFYSTIYKYMPGINESKTGYSLLLKFRIRYSYWISKRVALSVGDEVLYGLVENNNVPAKTGPGFTENGLDANKIMAGLVLKITKNFTILPYYLYETTYAKNRITSEKDLTSKSHYLFLIIKYKLWKGG